MTEIIALTFPESLIRVRIPVWRVAEFEANPLADVWDKHDDEQMELHRWLDANTPGWETRVKSAGPRDHELVIGGNVTCVEYNVEVLFRDSKHRDAYRAFRDAGQPPQEVFRLDDLK